jgi:general secretion pathway protein D
MKRIAAIALLLIAGCAGNPKIDEGRELIAQGKIEEGLALMEVAARRAPRDPEAYNVWVTQRDAVVTALVREGDLERTRGSYEPAAWIYQRALAIDPTSSGAQNGLAVLERDRRHATQVVEAEQAFQRGDVDAADRSVRLILKENPLQREARALAKNIGEKRALVDTATPILKAAMNKPVTLEFRDAPLRSIFEVIARSSGINFVFDRDVRQDLRATIFMRNTNLDEVIRVLLTTHQLDRKILNENSILIYPNTPAKQKDYQELAMRSFYLANADAKQTAAMIRALVKTRDLYIDEKLNLVVMKDTPDAIRLAEQLVATQDLGEPEVLLEVEVIEVASSLIRDIGLKYPEAVSFGAVPAVSGSDTGGGSSVPARSVRVNLNDWSWYITNPALTINLLKTEGSVNTLANPRIRVKNREKAKIHIGEKVPVITSTIAANVGSSSSVNYLEVGLKLEVEPNIYLDNEVGIKVGLEVSNILAREVFDDTVAYRVGTRNAATVLRLRDGETQILAGLISDEDRRSVSKVPFIGDFPLLGRLFRNDNDQVTKTEIALLITPRVVRNLTRPETVAAQFHSGTDSAPGSLPLRLTSAGPRSFSMTPSGGGGPAGNDTATSRRNMNLPGAPRVAADDVALTMSGPSDVAIGEEFVLSFGLPMRVEGANVRLQLAYDPKVLSVVSGAGGVPGRAVIELTAASIGGTQSPIVQVRFRAIAAAPTTTEILIEPLNATDSAQRALKVSTPGSHVVTVGAKQASQSAPAASLARQ